ncbi:hypothetical protein AKO1_015382 [Acrasis kona]|uniref:C2 NT-type domain-containing protein n=1 Tax=Acrasis kona TaxID=1008807 RepID=A0AAW2ZHQ5_9EUKA
MFKKFGNITKEPCKFSFNLSVDNIDGFKAPEVKPAPKTAPTYSIKWKRGDKRKGETPFITPQGSRLVFNQTFKFSGTLFKEKSKKAGKSAYGKKLLNITLEEKGERNKITVLAKAEVDLSEFVDDERELTNSTNVKLAIDKKTNATLKLTINSKSLKDLKPGDEGYTNASTYTGVESETEDEKSAKDDESEKSEKSEKSERSDTDSKSEKTAESISSDARTQEKKKNKDTESDKSESEDDKTETETEDDKTDKTEESSTPVKATPPKVAVAPAAAKTLSPASPTNDNHELELENKKLHKQIEDLQHKIEEIEQLKSKSESNNWAVMVKKIQKERDDVKEKMRSLELEMEQVKVESARAQQAQAEAEKVLNDNNKKSQAEKQKLEKNIAELKEKSSNVNDEQINLVIAQKAELEQKCESLSKKLNDMQQLQKNGDDDGDELRNTIQRLEKENAKQLEELESSQQQIAQLKSKIEVDNKSLKVMFTHIRLWWSYVGGGVTMNVYMMMMMPYERCVVMMMMMSSPRTHASMHLSLSACLSQFSEWLLIGVNTGCGER